MPNHPKKGLTAVNVRLDAEMLARLDADAAAASVNAGQTVHRTDMIRMVLDMHLGPAAKPAKRTKP